MKDRTTIERLQDLLEAARVSRDDAAVRANSGDDLMIRFSAQEEHSIHSEYIIALEEILNNRLF